MLLLFLLEICICGIIYLYTKDRYTPMNAEDLKKNPVIIFFLPIASYIVEKLISGRFKSYERKLSAKLVELYGGRDTRNKLRRHLVWKTAYMIIALLIVTFFGASYGRPEAGYILFVLIVLLLVFYVTDRELDERIKKRSFSIQYDFPDFLNKLVLLINAGMTVPRAWEKIVADRKKTTPLYEELNTTYQEIRNGKPEMAAYEDFAKRCRVKEITKFAAAIIQNLRKGNGEMVTLLKLQSNECWQLRKNMAKKLGEEASTKLVFPLMIMFVGILVIVMLPAILQLKYL